MMKKKIWHRIAACLVGAISVFACFGLAACSPDESSSGGGNENTTPGGNESTTPGGNESTTPGGNESTTPGGSEGTTPGGNEEADTSVKLTGKIYLVGDSTVCAFSDNYFYPRYGYGTQLYNYINCDQNQIVNLAISGRSSKSFLTESNYTTLTSSITAGDYLIIGFGHNDEKSAEPARFTDPVPDYQTATSSKGDGFQYTLYEKYVKVATDKGATPILCTPIVRYDASGAYTGSVVHNTADGDYAAAIRKLGADTNTTVIDLTALTKALYMADNAEAAKFHAYTTYNSEADKTPSGIDTTHINLYGARAVAYQFAQAMLKTNCTLKNNIKTDSKAPGQADYEAAKNTSYVKPSYTPFNPENYSANRLKDNWYKTAMGNLGGDKTDKFTIDVEEDAFIVGNTEGNGKFESGSNGKTGSDGFAAAFMQIKKQDNFTATATVTVNSVNTINGQSGFGIMLRDNILINKNDTTEKSNYIAAGILGTTGTTIFSRKGGSETITKNATAATSNPIAANDVFTLEFKRTGQTITCKVGNLEFSETDFDFFAVDNDYMYLCLFANRGYVVKFTDISVQIDANAAQGA